MQSIRFDALDGMRTSARSNTVPGLTNPALGAGVMKGSHCKPLQGRGIDRLLPCTTTAPFMLYLHVQRGDDVEILVLLPVFCS